jgi:hypothetical protein
MDSTNWTLTNLKQATNKTDGAYWLLVKNASITSPQIDLQTLDSVVVNMRTYQNRATISILLNENSIGKVTALTNTMQCYTWTAPELSGTSTLQFIGEDATNSYGVGVNGISLYLSGEKATYNNYLTHCTSTPATDINQVILQSNSQKIFRDGQLYICVQGQIFDSMGRVVKQ